MALLRGEYSSQVLEMTTSFQAVLPDEGELGDVKTVYLLHGLTDNCTGWTRYSCCERYARERGVALVIPEVQRSFYIDGASGLRYFTYVSQELPRAMQRLFGLSPEREKNYVMGLSMGGYGALKCALTYPERYAGCGSFSGVTDLDGLRALPSPPLHPWEFDALLGPGGAAGTENDLFALAAGKTLPPVYLSCGEQDSLYPMNVKFARYLESRGAYYRFDHRPGAHAWDFWDRSLRDCMDWLWKENGREEAPPAPKNL